MVRRVVKRPSDVENKIECSHRKHRIQISMTYYNTSGIIFYLIIVIVDRSILSTK